MTKCRNCGEEFDCSEDSMITDPEFERCFDCWYYGEQETEKTLSLDKIRKAVTREKKKWLLCDYVANPTRAPGFAISLSDNEKCLLTIYTDSIIDILEKEAKNNG